MTREIENEFDDSTIRVNPLFVAEKRVRLLLWVFIFVLWGNGHLYGQDCLMPPATITGSPVPPIKVCSGHGRIVVVNQSGFLIGDDERSRHGICVSHECLECV